MTSVYDDSSLSLNQVIKLLVLYYIIILDKKL